MRAAVAERLDRSNATEANRVQSPAGSLPGSRKWESCQTMPLVSGVFTGISRELRCCSILAFFSPSSDLEKPTWVTEVSMEQHGNEWAGGRTGDRRENPSTNGIVRHDSHMRKSVAGRCPLLPCQSDLVTIIQREAFFCRAIPLRSGARADPASRVGLRSSSHAVVHVSCSHTDPEGECRSLRNPEWLGQMRKRHQQPMEALNTVPVAVPRTPHLACRPRRKDCRDGETGDPREKPRRPAASSSTIPTCENSGVARPGIEPGFRTVLKNRYRIEHQMFVHWLLPHIWQFGIRFLFPCKIAIDSGSSRECIINSYPIGKNLTRSGAAVSERLDCSPPTKKNRIQSPAGSLLDFRKWESCRTMPLAGGFPRGFPASPALSFRRCFALTSITRHRLS
ncbi:hypothetical protein PR048_024462 [Dryococelus australis]|uniref:Uncharacterized protein n=1 Tax=Dryococelus australis TaxID=614101 RepID=A0ABQ9GNQ6_9NEOP|nr:hypothetical protein PR048_024462 [Dryococelus australis]